MIIEKQGYEPVECDKPLPCPFCGTTPELAQLCHVETWIREGRKSRKVKVCVMVSTEKLKSDTFWFKCQTCGCTTGKHCSNAQDAVKNWNTRAN